MDFKDFVNPPSLLRPAPFWAINDNITPEETSRQMSDMLDKGLSGGFFHSRAGLVTQYMGETWFDCMKAALKVAEQKDGYLWLYDEDLWPSGNAGGQVAALGNEYRACYLEPEYVAAGELPRDEPDAEPKAAYAILRREGARAEEIRGIDFGTAWQWTGVERLLLRKHYFPKGGWWSGESYSNLLNPDVTRKFIEFTHEPYRREFGEHFGKRIPGIFTDEPQVNAGNDRLFWYDGLPDVYREMTGRNLWADIPSLWLDGPEHRKIRLLAYRTIIAQFCRAYSKPIYDWCEKHGIAHTGHYNAEETFMSQISNHGGGIMAHYRYQQIPGIDHLCRNTDGLLFTVKQCASAARQLGRSMVLTEIFGVSHHTNTFEDFKWLGDYDMVLGAAFFCPHLTWYSMRGKRKRDYPPNWNYQQTYWEHLKGLNDYFARLASVLTAGTPSVEVLVLHSIESATAAFRRGLVTGKRNVPNRIGGPDTGAANALDGLMRSAVQAISDAGYDCDLGDEGYLADYGKVEGGRFAVGKMSYSVVVVPEATTWRPGTMDLLEKFADANGTVILLGRVPQELDCDPAADRWTTFADRKNVLLIPSSGRELQCTLDKVVKAPWRLRGRDGLPVKDTYAQYRVDGDKAFLFVVNSSRDSGREYRLTLFGAAGRQAAVWNPLDGTRGPAQTRKSGADLECEFSLPPCGSLLLAVGEGVAGKEKPAHPLCTWHGEVRPLPNKWKFARTQENVLVLDRIAYSLDGGKTFSDDDMDFRVRRKIAEHFGTNESLAWQPWVAVKKHLFDGRGGEVVLRYRFANSLAKVPKAAVVIEDLHKGRLVVNGTPVDASKCTWHWDRGFGKADITGLVRTGQNVVDFAFKYDFLSEVENAYVVGDFGARVRKNGFEGEMCSEPATLANGSWVDQGYAFYVGSMIYRTTVEHKPSAGARTVLRLVEPSGTLFVVHVNGKQAGRILWRPYELDITDSLRKGENDLGIEVVSSQHNAHGPLHVREGDSYRWFGPNSFQDEGCTKKEFSLFDYGLLRGAELVTVKA